MPQTKEFLMSSDAAEKRLRRLGGSVKRGEMAIHVEMPSEGYVKPYLIEFDADDRDHANDIAKSWLVHLKATSVEFYYVQPNGSLSKSEKPNG